MLQLLLSLLIPTAHAAVSSDFPTSTYGFDMTTWTTGAITYLFSVFWTPFGIISSAMILIAIAIAVVFVIRRAAHRIH